MKFQNPSFNFFLNGQTHGCTDGRTDGQAESNMPPLFQSFGHNNVSCFTISEYSIGTTIVMESSVAFITCFTYTKILAS